MKPTLNEQLARMQKLAGIITENQINENSLLDLINDYVDYTATADQGYGTINVDGKEMDKTEYAELQREKIKPEIIKLKGEQYFEDLDNFASLKLSASEYSDEDLTDELEVAANKLGFSLEDLSESKESQTNEGYDEFQRADKGSKDVTAKDKGEEEVYGAGVEKGEEIEKKKMTKEQLKAQIKEMILAELAEDSLNEDDDIDVNNPGDLNNMYDPLAEAKKDEEVEDITVDDTEVVDAPASDMMTGESAEISGIQANLQSAYAEAKALGDEKLITQIANTITYFTKAHILDTAPVNESMFPMLKRIIK